MTRTHRLQFLVAAFAALVAGAAVAAFSAGAPTAHASRAKTVTVRKVVRGKRGVTGAAGARGSAGAVGLPGPQGDQGPPGAAARDSAQSLTINWRNGNPAAGSTAGLDLPGLATLDAVCDLSTRQLTFTPKAARLFVSYDTFAGAGSSSITHDAPYSDGAPITVPLPENGMLQVVVSLQPSGGDGGAGPPPVTLLLSSDWKVNDPDPAPNTNHCFVAAQLLQAAS